LNLVHGAQEAAEALVSHPEVKAVQFVGSEPVARRIYQLAAQHGKRVSAAGGAKNHLVVMPDANLDQAIPAILNSAFGNAGERCLAGSVAVGVGGIGPELLERIVESARRLKVGPGWEEGVQVGPLIREEHRKRVVGYIQKGLEEGARLALDGRGIEGKGFFLGPTVLDRVSPRMVVGREEIFGPVLSVSYAQDLEEAIAQANAVPYGNMATIFTQSGRAAREFRERVQAGMVGINVGVAQPFAFYPFSGWRNSFFGDLHPHGPDAFLFYTQRKVVVE
ncbi:aldehyde dehydrogenase family protein, partial [Thermus antranikianii]